MNRREVREYYRKSIGVFVLISSMFILAASLLAIYVADFEELSTQTNAEASNLALYGLYTAFLLGTIITITFWILGINHLRKDSESVMRLQKLPSMFSIFIGVLCFGISTSIYFKTKDMWDEYTTVIFALLAISGLVIIVLNVVILIFTYKGLRFYDDRKLAKDVPKDMTIIGNDIKRMGYIAFMYSLIGTCVAFMSLYFSKQIVLFDKQFVENNEFFSFSYDKLFSVILEVAVCSIVFGILVIVLKRKKGFIIANKITFIINTVLMFIFVVLSVVSISKNFAKSSYPDVAYIVFTLILVVVCIVLNLAGIKLAKKTNQ